ncbi:MAG TPA: DUF1598 domain-containing protein [Planctomycetes bacterium]|nr:DUF1598 domain-containing protein [Planctomycetota bacterium]
MRWRGGTMRKRSELRGWVGQWRVMAAAMLGVWLWGGATGPACGQGAAIQARLAAGEFAPALALARQLPEREERDVWLARIAGAQAQTGATRAALRTAEEISDDRVRAQALAAVATVPVGGRGGAALADFQSLINLIQSTVAPESWDLVGGPGSIAPFPTGVYVDPEGLLEKRLRAEPATGLAALRAASKPRAATSDTGRVSALRKISLPRLEKYLHLRLAAGKPPTETMQVLAGLTRIQYVFVYPESGDLVLAGPAGPWRVDEENRVVRSDTGQPVILLDDLVVVLRQRMEGPGEPFGCMINPTRGGLARLRAFLERSKQKPLPPGRRARRQWLDQLRKELGKQDIEIFGIDPATRAARVMVEADYRMKLVGLGLEEAVPGMENYFDSIPVGAGQPPPPMSVVRWWFTLNYHALRTTADRNAFAIVGQGVRVLSENEKLAADGTRIHTGQADLLNQRFAHEFTRHFEALCHKYPVYGELRNLFDLALVCSLIRRERLAEKVSWHMTCFGDPAVYGVARARAPRQVDSVIRHRAVPGGRILAAISGGVMVNPSGLVSRRAILVDGRGTLGYQYGDAKPAELPRGTWWWD